jgi:hypothetical protein
VCLVGRCRTRVGLREQDEVKIDLSVCVYGHEEFVEERDSLCDVLALIFEKNGRRQSDVYHW